MTFSLTPRRRRWILVVTLFLVALQSFVRLIGYDPIPWASMVAFAIGTALVVGPLAWLVRDRIPPDTREQLTYVAAGVALLALPLIIGIGLIVGNLPLVFDAAAFGSVVGIALIVLVERTFVPDRLRETNW